VQGRKVQSPQNKKDARSRLKEPNPPKKKSIIMEQLEDQSIPLPAPKSQIYHHTVRVKAYMGIAQSRVVKTYDIGSTIYCSTLQTLN
jgi:hypothetical protein